MQFTASESAANLQAIVEIQRADANVEILELISTSVYPLVVGTTAAPAEQRTLDAKLIPTASGRTEASAFRLA